MTTLTAPSKPIDLPIPVLEVGPVSWLDQPIPRPSLRWRFANFFVQIKEIALAFADPIIDGLTDRDIKQQTALHNTLMDMDGTYARIIAAYFFVHQPCHYRGERCHPKAVRMFKGMDKQRSIDFLDVLRAQHNRAIREVMRNI